MRPLTEWQKAEIILYLLLNPSSPDIDFMEWMMEWTEISWSEVMQLENCYFCNLKLETRNLKLKRSEK